MVIHLDQDKNVLRRTCSANFSWSVVDIIVIAFSICLSVKGGISRPSFCQALWCWIRDQRPATFVNFLSRLQIVRAITNLVSNNCFWAVDDNIIYFTVMTNWTPWAGYSLDGDLCWVLLSCSMRILIWLARKIASSLIFWGICVFCCMLFTLIAK